MGGNRDLNNCEYVSCVARARNKREYVSTNGLACAQTAISTNGLAYAQTATLGDYSITQLGKDSIDIIYVY